LQSDYPSNPQCLMERWSIRMTAQRLPIPGQRVGRSGVKVFDRIRRNGGANRCWLSGSCAPEPLWSHGSEGSGAIIDRIPLNRSGGSGYGGHRLHASVNTDTKWTDKLIAEAASAKHPDQKIPALVGGSKWRRRNWALAAGYSVASQHQSRPAGVKRTDTITTLNLVVRFPGPKSSACAAP